MALGRPISLTNNVATKTTSVTATGGQTLFTVEGGYRVNELAVFKNGLKLEQETDFAASDGSTVTLTSGATGGDVLQFEVFDSFKITDAINANETTQTIDGSLVLSGAITGEAGVKGVGIFSGGDAVTTGIITSLNFIGAGNTFAVSSGKVDISIAGGGGGGGLGTAINYDGGNVASPFSFIDTEAFVESDLLLDATNAGANDSYVVSVSPKVTVLSGAAVTVGSGKTMVIDILQIGDL